MDAVEQSGGGPVGAGGDHAVAEALAFELAGAVPGLGRPVHLAAGLAAVVDLGQIAVRVVDVPRR